MMTQDAVLSFLGYLAWLLIGIKWGTARERKRHVLEYRSEWTCPNCDARYQAGSTAPIIAIEFVDRMRERHVCKP